MSITPKIFIQSKKTIRLNTLLPKSEGEIIFLSLRLIFLTSKKANSGQQF
jgi:hypothetical protein